MKSIKFSLINGNLDKIELDVIRAIRQNDIIEVNRLLKQILLLEKQNPLKFIFENRPI